MNTVDKLQAVREQIASLQETEKALANALKAHGLGLYSGSVADCLVQEVDVARINVSKLLAKLNIKQHVFNRFYTINTTQVRAKIVNKTINKKVA